MSRELQSADISALVKALVNSQKKIGHAVFDSKNPHFKNDYASLESVIDATKEKLAENGLVIIQQPYGDELVTTLAHESGQWMRSFTKIIMEKPTAQSQGSGLTYTRRYASAAMVNIGQTDDDGNAATADDSAPITISSRGPASSVPTLSVNSRPTPSSAGNFKCSFGKKYKGLSIKEIVDKDGLPSFQKYLYWFEDESKKTGKPISFDVNNFIKMGEKYLTELVESRRETPADFSPTSFQDEPWPNSERP